MSIGPYGSGAFGTIPFSNTPLFNTKTLIDAILRDTGHSSPDTETVKRQVVLGFLNNRYARVSTSHHWDWLNQSIDFNFDAPYAPTATVTLTNGSNIVTGNGTSFDSTMINRRFICQNYVHLVTAVNSPTELELEAEWAGNTGSVYTFRIVKSLYQLPADCEHIRSISVDTIGEMVPMGNQEFTRKKQYRPDYVGIPVWFNEVARRAEDGVRTIDVYPHPDKSYNVHLVYGVNIMSLQDSVDSFPLIPDRHRVVLYYGALAEMYRYLRDPEHAALAEGDFQKSFFNMQSDTQLTDSRYILQPARNYSSRRRRRQFRVTMDRMDFSRDG